MSGICGSTLLLRDTHAHIAHCVQHLVSSAAAIKFANKIFHFPAIHAVPEILEPIWRSTRGLRRTTNTETKAQVCSKKVEQN